MHWIVYAFEKHQVRISIYTVLFTEQVSKAFLWQQVMNTSDDILF
jgi:hypothetical protein